MATNLATDQKSDWVAWVAVALLALAIAIITAVLERRREQGQAAGGTAVESREDGAYGASVSGLQMRERRIIIRADGQEELITDIFNEELARQRLRHKDGEHEAD